MLCLRGFELYSRWVPLLSYVAFLSHPNGRPQVTTTSTMLWCPAVLVKTKKEKGKV